MNATQLRELRRLVNDKFNQLHREIVDEQHRRRDAKRKEALAEIAKLDERFAKRLNALVDAARTAVEGIPNVGILSLTADWDGTGKKGPSLFMVADLRWDDDYDTPWEAYNKAREQALIDVSMMAFSDTSEVTAFLSQIPTASDLLDS